ncbi:MAG: hypothetical protein ACYC6Y_11260 [Thermoguttaceae bacterium]
MAHENPFSTRFTRPGAMPFQPPAGQDLPILAARFEALGRAGQIVGPHGSGKSTLLADLVRHWEESGQRVVVIELHDGQRRLPVCLPRLLQGDRPPSVIAVDGYEQLGLLARGSLRRFCGRHRIGLIVTAHRSMGIPDLARCAPGLDCVRGLVRDLVAGKEGRITDDRIRDSFDRHEGNVREVLFELYDLYEDTAAPSRRWPGRSGTD